MFKDCVCKLVGEKPQIKYIGKELGKLHHVGRNPVVLMVTSWFLNWLDFSCSLYCFAW